MILNRSIPEVPSNKAMNPTPLRALTLLQRPMSVDLNGVVVAGRKDLAIPADGAVTLKTDGQGPIQTGSVTVISDRNISGVNGSPPVVSWSTSLTAFLGIASLPYCKEVRSRPSLQQFYEKPNEA